MKIRHLLISASTILMLTAGNAWAGVDHRPYPKPKVAPKPIIPVTPKPVVVVKPKPIIPVVPKPVVVVKPKPIIPVTPKPVVVVKPKPIIPVVPKPVVVVPPKPIIVVPPKPVIVVTPPGSHGGGHHKAPEINAASGTSAIALLTGVLLLTGERIRSRRT